MSDVLIKGMKMPETCADCNLSTWNGFESVYCDVNAEFIPRKEWKEKRQNWCPLIEVPPHGRLIDADALAADLKRQCKEVFKTDTVSPDDFWITRNQAYNERLWTTWCESLFDYFKAAPTIIEAERT